MSIVLLIAIVALLLPNSLLANDQGDRLVEQADSLYAVQQYQEALKAASEALPLTKGTDSYADCLNLLAVINIRLKPILLGTTLPNLLLLVFLDQRKV